MATLSRRTRAKRRAAAPTALQAVADLGCLVVRLDKSSGHYRITTPSKLRFDFWAGTQRWRSLQSSLAGDRLESLIVALGDGSNRSRSAA